MTGAPRGRRLGGLGLRGRERRSPPPRLELAAVRELVLIGERSAKRIVRLARELAGLAGDAGDQPECAGTQRVHWPGHASSIYRPNDSLAIVTSPERPPRCCARAATGTATRAHHSRPPRSARARQRAAPHPGSRRRTDVTPWGSMISAEGRACSTAERASSGMMPSPRKPFAGGPSNTDRPSSAQRPEFSVFGTQLTTRRLLRPAGIGGAA